MKLLFITQKLDKEDAILGFVHRWLEKFSPKFEKIIVICLEEGSHSLPENIKVFSLGKEKKISRPQYIINFYKYIFELRKDYDVIFSHMNQIYILFGWLPWKLWGKKVALWRNHPLGSWATNLAVRMSDVVFCTSPSSYTAKFNKTKIISAGVDTNIFKPIGQGNKIPNSILYVGRISPIKNIDILIETLLVLYKREVGFTAAIAGDAPIRDTEYKKIILEKAAPLIKIGRLKLLGEVPNYKLPDLYNEYKVVINLTQAGSFDKTILETMACETAPFVLNPFFKNILGPKFTAEDLNSEEIADKLEFIFKNPGTDYSNFRKYVVENQSLDVLINDLVKFLS